MLFVGEWLSINVTSPFLDRLKGNLKRVNLIEINLRTSILPDLNYLGNQVYHLINVCNFFLLILTLTKKHTLGNSVPNNILLRNF